MLVVIDTVTGVTEEDARIAEVVRNLAAGPVLLVVNKVDDDGREGLIWEALSLGLGDPHPVSALHGRGAGDLLDRLVDLLPAPAVVDDERPFGGRRGADLLGGARGAAERRQVHAVQPPHR